jgi:hypothetical protein
LKTYETLVILAEACTQFPVPISRPSIERLWRRGSRGIVLRTIFLVGRRYTSLEEIKRFIVATQHGGEDVPTAPISVMPKRNLEAARLKFNLPSPGKNGDEAENA